MKLNENPKEMYEEFERKRNQVRTLKSEIEVETLEYRIASVKRVLDYINDKCWRKENMNDLHTYIVHCLNKLNGNIDGVELGLKEKTDE